MKIEISPKWKK